MVQRQKHREAELERQQALDEGESPGVANQKRKIRDGQNAARANMLNDINATA